MGKRAGGGTGPGVATYRGLPRRLGKGGLGLGALILIPALLLYLPVFYYSLTTPFGLVDDYFLGQRITLLDDPARLFRWLQGGFYAGWRQWETSGIIAAGFILLATPAAQRQHWRRWVCPARNYGV